MEILQPEVLFGDLAVGGRRRYYRQENLRWRFASGVVSHHVAELSLKVYVGERLAGEHAFIVTGIAPRQAFREAGGVGSLAPNSPNPFNPTTIIRFSLPHPEESELAIYNLRGQRVATLVKGSQEAGNHVLQWDGRDAQGRELASGVYFYRLQAGNWVETRKLLRCR